MRVNLTSVLDLLFIMLFIFMADSHEAVMEQQKNKNDLIIRVRDLELDIASAPRIIKEKDRAIDEKEGRWRIVVLQRDEIASKAAFLASNVIELETDKVILTKELASTAADLASTTEALGGFANANSDLASQVANLTDQNQQLKGSLATAQINIEDYEKKLKGSLDDLDRVAEGIKKAIGNLDEETLKKLLSGFSVQDEESAKTVIKAMADSNSRNLVESLALFSKMTSIFLPIRIHLNAGRLTISAMGSNSNGKTIQIPSGLKEAKSTPSEWLSLKQGFNHQLKAEYKAVGNEREKQIVLLSYDSATVVEQIFLVEVMNYMQQMNPDSVIFVNSGYYKMEGNPK